MQCQDTSLARLVTWTTGLMLGAAAMALIGAAPASAEVVGRSIQYSQGETTYEGYIAYDDAVSTPRPGVLVVHQWLGLTGYEKGRARQLASLGYVAFVGDIYGKGVRPTDTDTAGALAGKYKADRTLLRARANLALAQLKASPLVDQTRLAAIGYCLGGTAALELALSGADLRGGVSFHGGLDAPSPSDAKNIRGKVLALAGADDPFQAPADLAAFESEMRDNKVDWQIVVYGGAVHAFTQPDPGFVNPGAQYNEKADRRSWRAMQDFFAEIFSAN